MEWIALRAWRRQLVADLYGRVLEIGVGTGRNLAFYPREVKLTAVDVAPRMLRIARRRARRLGRQVTFVEADARALPFRTASFDAVVTTCVFCSVSDPHGSIAEIRRVLRPGGRLRMLEHQRPDNPGLARVFDRLNALVVRLSGANINRETQRTIEAAGFDSVHALRHDRFGVVRSFDVRDEGPCRAPTVG